MVLLPQIVFALIVLGTAAGSIADDFSNSTVKVGNIIVRYSVPSQSRVNFAVRERHTRFLQSCMIPSCRSSAGQWRDPRAVTYHDVGAWFDL